MNIRFSSVAWLFTLWLCLGLPGLPGLLAPAVAQETPRSEEPGYSEGEKRRIARRNANRSDPNLSVDKQLRRGGEEKGFLGIFRRWFAPKPRTEPYGYEGEDRRVPQRQRWRRNRSALGFSGDDPPRRPGDKFWNSNQPNYQGEQRQGSPDDKFSPDRNPNVGYSGTQPAVDPKRRWRRNNGALGWAGNDAPAPRANRNIQEAVEGYAPNAPATGPNANITDQVGRYQGNQPAVDPKKRWRWNIASLLFSGNQRARDPEDKFDTPYEEGYAGEGRATDPKERYRNNEGGLDWRGNGYVTPRANEDIMEAIDGYAPSNPTYPANSNIMDAIARYRGNMPAVDPEKRWRWNIAGLLFSGNQEARDPEDKFDTPYEENWQGNDRAIDPEERWRTNNDGLLYSGTMRAQAPEDKFSKRRNPWWGYSGEMRAVDPKERYRDKNGPAGWQGFDYVAPRFNEDIMKAISEYAPDPPQSIPNENILRAINEYTAYHTIRTEKAQARYYRRLTKKSSEYLGEYPQRMRGRLSFDGHPTQVHLIGDAMANQERSQFLRSFTIWWNRIFARNIQPNVFKKRQRRPGYDRGEAEWMEQLNQPNSVDPAEGGESATEN